MSKQEKLETVCDNCRKKVRFDPRLIGKLVLCPNCKSSITLASVAHSPLFNETLAVGGGSTYAESQIAPSVSKGSSKPSQQQILAGRYDLVNCLGKGGFGEVWEAVDRRMNRTVAIKLPRFLPNEHKKIERFLREGRAAAGLRHPNIVSVFDAAESNGQHYLAIEFVDGRPLSEFGNDKKLSHKAAAKMIAELARALHYAHSQRIIHRDIKPQNIVVNSAGQPQILDFGLAKSLAEETALTLDGTVMGTPAYMSPEQARGDTKNVGTASDQYSLGASLYWLLTGQPLFAGPPAAVLAQVINSSPTRPKLLCADLDDRLNAICLKSIAKLPSDRYASCIEMARDLDRFLNDEVVEARPIGAVGRAIRWANRNRFDAGLAIATSLLLILSTATSLIGYFRSRTLLSEASQLENTAQTTLDDIERTKSELERQTDILNQAKSRSQQAKLQLVQAQQSAEESQSQLKKLVAENEVLQTKSKIQLEFISKNESQSLQINNLVEKTEIETKQAAAKSFATQPQTDRLLERAFSEIERRNFTEAAKRLSDVDPQFRDIRWRAQMNIVKLEGELNIVKKKRTSFKQPNGFSYKTFQLHGIDMTTNTLQLRLNNNSQVIYVSVDIETGGQKNTSTSSALTKADTVAVNSGLVHVDNETGENSGILYMGKVPVCRVRDKRDEPFVAGCISKEMEVVAFLTSDEVIIIKLGDLDSSSNTDF
jgi:serine/threonine protein kinase